MHTATPAIAASEPKGNDSIETLGFSGATLMQLWSIGVATISDLDTHDSPEFKKRLTDALGSSASARNRIEKALTEVGAVMKVYKPVSTEAAPATVIELRPVERKQETAVDAALTEDERAYAAMPSSNSDPIPLITYHMRRHKLLARDAQNDLARRVQDEDDQKARDLLVSHNLRLVRKIASRYLWSKLELADLIQEGVIGLMTAIEKFDYTLGNAFSTYATWWIRQGITRAIQDQSSLVRIPVHLQESAFKMRRAMNVIASETGRTPTISEIAKVIEMTPAQVKNLLKVMRMSYVSIDTPERESDEGERDWHELLADEFSVPADIILMAREELDEACARVNHVTEVLYEDETIKERARDIFVDFYGLGGSLKRRTLEDVGDRFGVTREAIRLMVARCWEKLQLQGVDMDHDSLCEEFIRIGELEKLARKSVSVD